jgi:hypothetical protein
MNACARPSQVLLELTGKTAKDINFRLGGYGPLLAPLWGTVNVSNRSSHLCQSERVSNAST